MKLTPFQLAALVVGGFASIILLNVLAKYQSNEEFANQLKELSPKDLFSIRQRRVAEENMEPVNAGDIEEETVSEGTSYDG